MIFFLQWERDLNMTMKRAYFSSSLAGAALVAALLFGAGGPAFACGDGSCEPPTETTKGNNGFGQEKHGAAQDGENPGSDKGKGVPRGGPGAGLAGEDSKQNGTGLR